jgi:choloylglycine hydrolase
LSDLFQAKASMSAEYARRPPASRKSLQTNSYLPRKQPPWRDGNFEPPFLPVIFAARPEHGKSAEAIRRRTIMYKRPALAFAFLLALAPVAQACTTLLLKAKDGAVVSGRTLEFGFDMKSDILVVPAGTPMKGSLPNGATGISYTTKYGMVGANVLGYPVIIDGINEKGLFVSDLYFPGYAGYAKATPETASRAMAAYEYGNWLLGNFATVDEVRAHAQDVVLVGTPVDALGGPPPVHFIIRDRSGKSLVIEPLDGKLVVYDDPLGVMTNSPTFDWHLTNLRNYVTLTEQNVPPVRLNGGVTLRPFGQGSGMFGLPGDGTPPARFVRAVAYSQTAVQPATANEAVLQVFHIMNNFDIPLGSVRDRDGNVVHMDYTVWTSVADLQNDRWYFRTYDDQAIRMVDLHTALAAAGNKVRTISMNSHQAIIDTSTALRAANE